LYLSGLTQQQVSADEDYKLLQVGIGFTNMVQRATKGSADLTRKEIKEGSQILLEKLRKFRPKIAVFNGKLIYEVFSGKKDFKFGRQPDLVDGTNTVSFLFFSFIQNKFYAIVKSKYFRVLCVYFWFVT
jgi:mismatch-specific thymine-DNA glycosylase